MYYLIIDGCLNGTGIRHEYEGGYLDTSSLNLSQELRDRIKNWVNSYETAHYDSFQDEVQNHVLDAEGISIAISVKKELVSAKISYFSNAFLTKYTI